jgi:hypothetical protein
LKKKRIGKKVNVHQGYSSGWRRVLVVVDWWVDGALVLSSSVLCCVCVCILGVSTSVKGKRVTDPWKDQTNPVIKEIFAVYDERGWSSSNLLLSCTHPPPPPLTDLISPVCVSVCSLPSFGCFSGPGCCNLCRCFRLIDFFSYSVFFSASDIIYLILHVTSLSRLLWSVCSSCLAEETYHLVAHPPICWSDYISILWVSLRKPLDKQTGIDARDTERERQRQTYFPEKRKKKKGSELSLDDTAYI